MTNVVLAANYTRGRTRPLRLGVLHDMEMGELPTTAEACADYFARQPRGSASGSSANATVDADSEVICVPKGDTPWAAPYVNTIGYHVEQTGFARQTRAQWLDAYSRRVIRRAARLMAREIGDIAPAVHLSHEALRRGDHGLIEHRDATAVFGPVGGHSDCGLHYPWDVFLHDYRDALGQHVPKAHDAWPLELGDVGANVTTLQRALIARRFLAAHTHSGATAADGIFGLDTRAAVKRAQRVLYPHDGTAWTGEASKRFVEDLHDLKASKPVVNVPELRRVLMIGALGNDVSSLQIRLRDLGLYDGRVDGVFGRMTSEAVYKAQKRFFPKTRSSWDRIVGPRTWRALWRARVPAGR